jgi:serine/threonine-protein kinase
MVGDDGRLRVLDFGLAKLRQSADSAVASEDDETVGHSGLLTREGAVVGTAPYMSPEQIKGLTVDPRSDVFSLGCIFYEMLVGCRSTHSAVSGKETRRPLSDRVGVAS